MKFHVGLFDRILPTFLIEIVAKRITPTDISKAQHGHVNALLKSTKVVDVNPWLVFASRLLVIKAICLGIMIQMALS